MNEIVTHFNSGKLTKQLDANTGLDKYPGGCREDDNFIVDQYGNATRRPGTQYVATADNRPACQVLVADPAKTQIYTVQQLQDIQDDVINSGANLTGGAGSFNIGNYELMNDITIPAGFAWTSWISGSLSTIFAGTFDGNFFTITFEARTLVWTGSVVDSTLIGQLSTAPNEARVEVKNFHLVIDYTTTNEDVFDSWGPLTNSLPTADAGEAIPLISQVSITGSITTSDSDSIRMASFIGTAGGAQVFEIERCWTDIDYTFNRAGNQNIRAFSGFAGILTSGLGSTITDCYARATHTKTGSGSLIWYSTSGGFSGSISEDVTTTNCYAAVEGSAGFYKGFVGAVVNNPTFVSCYWDKDIALTTADAAASGTTGLTTAQAKAQANYTNWDFNTIWTIDEGNNYPTLIWAKQINCPDPEAP